MGVVYVVTDLLEAFLGNGSVNTFQRVTMEAVSQWTHVQSNPFLAAISIGLLNKIFLLSWQRNWQNKNTSVLFLSRVATREPVDECS
jgi:hypothetical protein